MPRSKFDRFVLTDQVSGLTPLPKRIHAADEFDRAIGIRNGLFLTRWRGLTDLRYEFELAIEGPEIKSDFTPLALQKRACRRGARSHEIGTETIELAITTTGISFIASTCSGVAKTRMAPTPKVTACTIM